MNYDLGTRLAFLLDFLIITFRLSNSGFSYVRNDHLLPSNTTKKCYLYFFALNNNLFYTLLFTKFYVSRVYYKFSNTIFLRKYKLETILMLISFTLTNLSIPYQSINFTYKSWY